MIKKEFKNEVTWKDREKGIINENFSTKIKFLGITIYRVESTIEHTLDEFAQIKKSIGYD